MEYLNMCDEKLSVFDFLLTLLNYKKSFFSGWKVLGKTQSKTIVNLIFMFFC